MLHAIAIVTLGSITGQPTQTPESWLRAELQRPMPLQEVDRAKFEFLVVRPKPRRSKLETARDGTMPEFPGKSVTKYTLWSLGKDRWRFNIDFPGLPDPKSQYSDVCENGDESWIGAPSYLSVTRTDWGFGGEMGAVPARYQWEGWARLLLSAGLSRAESFENEAESVVAQGGDRYRAVVRLGSPAGTMRHRVDFVWNAELGRGFVKSRKVLSADADRFVGLGATFGEWKPTDVGGFWIASRVDMDMGGEGGPFTIVPVSLSQPEEESITKLLSPPLPGVPDAVRGEVQGGIFEDYRTRKPVVYYGGTMNSASAPLPMLPGMDRTAKLFAWAAGGLVLFLVCSVISRRRNSSRA